MNTKYFIIFLFIISINKVTIAQQSEYLEKGYELLHNADQGILKSAKELIEKDSINVDFTDDDGVTPLMLASQSGHAFTVKYLVSKGADVNLKSYEHKISPLTSAAKNNHLDIVEILYQNGADINTIDAYGRTPLHYSVAFGHIEIIKLLLSYKADPNIVDNFGVTPIRYAVEDKNDSIINLLITNNADINIVSNDNSNLLHIAAYYGNIDFIKDYADNFDINGSLNYEGMTAIDMAIAGGNEDILEWFINSGYKPRDTINDIITPLTLAKSANNKNIIKIIKSNKIKDIPYLYFRRISIGYDFIFNPDNFFMSINTGLCEDRYGFNLELGFMFNGSAKWISLQQNADMFYILKESRKGFYLGIGKDIKIINLPYNSYVSIYGKIRTIFFWSRYKGINADIVNTNVISPAIGVALNFNRYVRLFYENSYFNFYERDDMNIMFNIGIKGFINIRKPYINEKYRYIINY
ncbi:MAG: ankyrin repeat domain-containing protein [Bacteroidales bacterium]|jgi:ankyrin repeat protein|nr:ankyrin repeat domain-containing protein [Bacteroidales bacterium]